LAHLSSARRLERLLHCVEVQLEAKKGAVG
jgi:hypothetical protein